MTDLFERAQEVEQAFRDNAIARQLDHAVEQPLIDKRGSRFCVACCEPIPPARLAANPNAVRCIDCQTAKER